VFQGSDYALHRSPSGYRHALVSIYSRSDTGSGAELTRSDRVIIMDQGRIIEQGVSIASDISGWLSSDSIGVPAALLRDAASRFYSMCGAQGDEEFARLKNLCRD
jgi:hypothetical protein